MKIPSRLIEKNEFNAKNIQFVSAEYVEVTKRPMVRIWFKYSTFKNLYLCIFVGNKQLNGFSYGLKDNVPISVENKRWLEREKMQAEKFLYGERENIFEYFKNLEETKFHILLS